MPGQPEVPGKGLFSIWKGRRWAVQRETIWRVATGGSCTSKGVSSNTGAPPSCLPLDWIISSPAPNLSLCSPGPWPLCWGIGVEKRPLAVRRYKGGKKRSLVASGGVWGEKKAPDSWGWEGRGEEGWQLWEEKRWDPSQPLSTSSPLFSSPSLLHSPPQPKVLP